MLRFALRVAQRKTQRNAASSMETTLKSSVSQHDDLKKWLSYKPAKIL